jgi:hypothetical protein
VSVRSQIRLLALLGIPWLCASAGEPLPAHRAEYLVTRDALPVATMVMELEIQPDGGYLYRSVTRPEGALALVGMALDIASGAQVTEESAGRVEKGRFRPLRYRYRRDNDDTRELSVTFDWADDRANMDSEGRPWSMPVPPNATDKLAVLLDLRQDLAAGARSPAYPVADGGRLKSYAYEVLDREEIGTPAGTWETVALRRSKDGAPADYRLWLAPGLRYLPVLVDREENGSLYRMELTSVEGLRGGPPEQPGP